MLVGRIDHSAQTILVFTLGNGNIRVFMAQKSSLVQPENKLLLFTFFGDIAAGYAGLAMGYWLRVRSPLGLLGVEADASISFWGYQPLIWLGLFFLIASFTYLGIYDAKLLLRPHRSSSLVMRGCFWWLFVFLGFSLAFRLEPQISRLFVLISTVTTFLTLTAWRHFYFHFVSKGPWRGILTQRVVVIGWSKEVARLVEAIGLDSNHPYEIAGVVPVRDHLQGPSGHLQEGLVLGDFEDINQILDRNDIDIAVLADQDLSREQLVDVMHICERHYVQFKVVPSFFQIFISSLQMQSISSVPILGLETLRISQLANKVIKRMVDIVGSLVGLLLSAPLFVVLVLLIKREDNNGSVIYKQERIGRSNRPFKVLKIRSMKIGPASQDHQFQSTQREDPRFLRCGAWMRRWNLDEIPQFWNVLKGDMSLVGPRPERTLHVDRLSEEIRHYNPRHEVRPGLTGWAQVNGLRGDTSLVDRVRYDLYYIENWSIWFDFQIMILTFLRRQNAH